MFRILFFASFYLLVMCKRRSNDTNDDSHIAPQSNCNSNMRTCILQEEKHTYHVSTSFLVTLMFLSSLMCLILLGVFKGLLGLLCCAPVGMWSLGALIDLPRPLDSYQESELAHVTVVYDQTGWPVHPNTGKRSVRAISKKTEFFLNTIFFLAYPLAVMVSLCGSCCLKDPSDHEVGCYKCVNTVVFNTCIPTQEEQKSGADIPVYSDEQSVEEEKDTQYVLSQMHQSLESLQKNKHAFD